MPMQYDNGSYTKIIIHYNVVRCRIFPSPMAENNRSFKWPESKYGTRFSHGAIASFECDVGYELVGSRSLLCLLGKWNAPVPVCNGKT